MICTKCGYSYNGKHRITCVVCNNILRYPPSLKRGKANLGSFPTIIREALFKNGHASIQEADLYYAEFHGDGFSLEFIGGRKIVIWLELFKRIRELGYEPDLFTTCNTNKPNNNWELNRPAICFTKIK